MASYVTSKDGTQIAFDRLGQGRPVVVVSGIFCDRQTTQKLAEQLAKHFTVINYDRRGRGESSATAPYAVQREIEDLGSLIAEAGGTAFVYGHSSGAALALNAAAHGLPIARLVLHEPPYGADDETSKQEARELAELVRLALAEERRADAIMLFFSASGMRPELALAMSRDPKLLAASSTMFHDFEVVGDLQGGHIPEDLVRSIRVPTLVLAGDASPDFFRTTARRIVSLLPNGEERMLEGQDHSASADVVAPVVAAFFSS